MESNCCNAPIIEETDVCLECLEHCETVEDEAEEFDELMSVENKKVTYNGEEINNENTE